MAPPPPLPDEAYGSVVLATVLMMTKPSDSRLSVASTPPEPPMDGPEEGRLEEEEEAEEDRAWPPESATAPGGLAAKGLKGFTRGFGGTAFGLLLLFV